MVVARRAAIGPVRGRPSGSWWRCGASKPRSAEFSVSGSPSAAAGVSRPVGDSGGVSPPAHPEWAWPGGPGTPPGASRISDAPARRGGNPPGGTGRLRGGQRQVKRWRSLCPGCVTRLRKPRLASDTVAARRRNQFTPVLWRYPLYRQARPRQEQFRYLLGHPSALLFRRVEKRQGVVPGLPGDGRQRGAGTHFQPSCRPTFSQATKATAPATAWTPTNSQFVSGAHTWKTTLMESSTHDKKPTHAVSFCSAA